MLKNKLFISAMLSASFTTGLTSRLNVQKSNFSNELLTIHLYAFLTQAYMLAHSLNAVEQDGFVLKWFTEFGHLNRGDMLTSEQHRCHNEKKKFQRRV
ncbi:hypothetical protein MU351_004016 [Salmonella enterica]|nr:hypothetical protein [Salmonella enterica subsp. enterica serovar Kentucky]EJA4858119.1 hypothetical protein [Salmonella enterica]EJJ1094420.1 hypothetical protein [Salmonella enterica subsp. enterica]ECS5389446.1 hypothetical protein [Salmonella enterica subsp. enterica serovar Kentucky]ECT0464616.1 hypothetical protein [Salmonella enterica subsp. enterica serovar Kentucky]